jgi:hypothetical protein
VQWWLSLVDRDLCLTVTLVKSSSEVNDGRTSSSSIEASCRGQLLPSHVWRSV